MNDDFKDFDLTPTLSFDVEENSDEKINLAKEEKKEVFKEEKIELSEEEKKMVEAFVEKIDLTNSNSVLQYGAGAQKKIADFSGVALNNVKSKDLGEVGDMLSSVVVQLKDFENGEEKKGIFSFFKKQSQKIDNMKAKYGKVEDNINKICTSLEKHQIQLLKDIAMLDKMYEVNLAYLKELNMYILAGKKKLESSRNGELKRLSDLAISTGRTEDAQRANDFASLCDRFEKKIHDLELTKMVSIQMAPQIRLIQNNDSIMSEKIQSTIVNTIPLWKSQIVLALGVAHSTNAIKAQNEVTNMTNELLRKNAETLKMSSIETAKAAERGIVDIETLKTTNEALISTLDEVMTIQNQGREKRKEAEKELKGIEEQLKNKLLELRR
ncbi:MAG: toxic anion resistance protein [Clostridium sp.]